jgi:hypothetical protein
MHFIRLERNYFGVLRAMIQRQENESLLKLYNTTICMPIEKDSCIVLNPFRPTSRDTQRVFALLIREAVIGQIIQVQASGLKYSSLAFKTVLGIELVYQGDRLPYERGKHLFNNEQFVIVLHENYLKFVTCHGVHTPLDFHLYVRPFEMWSWAFIVIYGLLIIPLSILILYWASQWALDKILPFSLSESIQLFTDLLFYKYAAVLENVQNESPVLKRLPLIGPVKFYNIIFASWILILVVLTNAYRGLVVSDLTSPRELTGGFDSLSNRTNMTLYVSLHAAASILGIQTGDLALESEHILSKIGLRRQNRTTTPFYSDLSPTRNNHTGLPITQASVLEIKKTVDYFEPILMLIE